MVTREGENMVNKLIEKDTKMFLTGNEVIAYAANAAEAEFMYGYPITPQMNYAYVGVNCFRKWTRDFFKQKMKFLQDFQHSEVF
jgi:2-oxoglutarate ferredoxin oxidoreductase subunit alpha